MKDKIFRVDYYPSRAFTDFSRMSAEEVAVIMQISNLIYLRGEPIDYDVKWIARSLRDIGAGRCQRIILGLLETGDLYLTEDGKISKKMCEIQLKSVRDRTEFYAKAGQKGAGKRWHSEENQNDNDGTPKNSKIARTRTNTSTIKKNPPLPPKAEAGTSENGPLKNSGEAERKFQIENLLHDSDLDALREAAPSWDKHVLFRHYDEQINTGQREMPKHPAKAFLGWAAKFTKGKPP